MHPISEILCQAYETLRQKRQVSFPLTNDNKNALDSVVKTVEHSFFGHDRFPTDEDKAVAYLCHLIKRHALTDGNKRLAILWFQLYCSTFELKPNLSVFGGYDVLAVSIEATDGHRLDETMRLVKKLIF